MGTQERRRWTRLELGIPMFFHGLDIQQGCPFTELAVALNLSAGGALIALRHHVAADASVQIEVPRPPISANMALPNAEQRIIEASVIRLEHREQYQLLGLQFAKPIGMNTAAAV